MLSLLQHVSYEMQFTILEFISLFLENIHPHRSVESQETHSSESSDEDGQFNHQKRDRVFLNSNVYV